MTDRRKACIEALSERDLMHGGALGLYSSVDGFA